MKNLVRVKRLADGRTRIFSVPDVAVAAVETGAVVKIPFGGGSCYGICQSDVAQMDDAQILAVRFALGLALAGEFSMILSTLTETPAIPEDAEPLVTGEPIDFTDDSAETDEE